MHGSCTEVLHSSYTMGTRGSPDIYTLSPRACGPRASGVYIRQTTRAHGIIIKYVSIYVLFIRISKVSKFPMVLCHTIFKFLYALPPDLFQVSLPSTSALLPQISSYTSVTDYHWAPLVN